MQDIHGAGIKFTWGAVSSQLIPYDFQIEAIDRRDLLADNVANALYHEVGYHPGDEFSKYLLEAASKCPRSHSLFDLENKKLVRNPAMLPVTNASGGVRRRPYENRVFFKASIFKTRQKTDT